MGWYLPLPGVSAKAMRLVVPLVVEGGARPSLPPPQRQAPTMCRLGAHLWWGYRKVCECVYTRAWRAPVLALDTPGVPWAAIDPGGAPPSPHTAVPGGGLAQGRGLDMRPRCLYRAGPRLGSPPRLLWVLVFAVCLQGCVDLLPQCLHLSWVREPLGICEEEGATGQSPSPGKLPRTCTLGQLRQGRPPPHST